MPEACILLVEDEALIRMMLAEMVEELGHRVVAEAGDMVAGQALAETAIFDLAILDINIAGDIITRSPRSSTGGACRLSLSAAMDHGADQKHFVGDQRCRNPC